MSESITIYHNPACSISVAALAMIRERGVEPQVIEYLNTPPSREKLTELLAAMGIKPRDLLRRKEPRYHELDLDNTKWTDEELVGFMVENPILMNRPIVVTSRGTRLGRPSEAAIVDILPG